MQISCPQCSTSFKVIPEDFGLKSRKVRCSKCFYVWQTEPKISNTDNVTSESEKFSLEEEKVFLPVHLRSHVVISKSMLVLPFILLTSVLVLLALTLKYNNLVKDWFLGEQKYIVLQELDNSIEADEDFRNITYTIYNQSMYEVSLPLIRIRTYDQYDKLVNLHIFENQAVVLKPKEFAKVKTKFQDIGLKLKNFDVTLGNKLFFTIY